MSEKKNIDKLFKEQLKNFEVAPSDAVWEHIERELHKDKKKRRVIPIWWKVAGVAAALVLLFTLGKTVWSNTSNSSIDHEVVNTNDADNDSNANATEKELTNPNSFEKGSSNQIVDDTRSDNQSTETPEHDVTTSEQLNSNPVVASDNSENKKESSKETPILKQKSQKSNAVANNKVQFPKENKLKSTSSNTNKTEVAHQLKEDHSKPTIASNTKEQEQSEIDKLINKTKTSKETRVATTNTSEKENTIAIIDSSKIKALTKGEDIEKAVANAEKNDELTEDPIKRWSIAPNVAPVYFNTLGKGSSIDGQFVNNSKEGDVNVSYGVKGSYAFNKKLKIRAGVNKVDLGYTTNNILVFDGAGRNAAVSTNLQLNTIKFQDSVVGNNAYVSANSVSFTTGPGILFTKEQGAISQQLGFIEVPIEIEYSLIDKTFGVNLIGGFSTLFLSNNEVYAIQNTGERTLLGEATNINDMSYSANFGIGLNYNISKQLRFNLEPTFKYQINTFNDTSGNFQPFFIGVYSGLSFKF